MSQYTNEDLYHFGVKGMKWGRRKIRGHAGPGRYISKKRQLEGDKRDLEALNRGEHLTVGSTKKRQAAYDARDRAVLKKRIAKNEAHFEEKRFKKELEEQKIEAKREASIKEIKKSRYGKTNGQIIADNILANIGIKTVGSIASGVSRGLGASATANAIDLLTSTANSANNVSTVYKLGTNYIPKKKKIK